MKMDIRPRNGRRNYAKGGPVTRETEKFTHGWNEDELERNRPVVKEPDKNYFDFPDDPPEKPDEEDV